MNYLNVLFIMEAVDIETDEIVNMIVILILMKWIVILSPIQTVL
jgi:hypothetical protein